MPTEYAQALARSLENITEEHEVENRVSTFFRVLARDGKTKALPAILREFIKLRNHNSARKSVLTVAKATDEEYARKELAKRLGETASEATLVVDDSLIGGWRYVDNDTLIDTSHKASLLELYRHIVS